MSWYLCPELFLSCENEARGEFLMMQGRYFVIKMRVGKATVAEPSHLSSTPGELNGIRRAEDSHSCSLTST